MNLPPLPEPQYMDAYLGVNVAYSQEQMLQLQQATVEACAKVCEGPTHYEDWEILGGAEGRDLCNALADKIRSMKHE